jgi:hypothetical protein
MGIPIKEGLNIVKEIQQTHPHINFENFNYLIATDAVVERILHLFKKDANVLLVGDPGTGKTSICNKIKGNYIINIASMGKNELAEVIGTKHKYTHLIEPPFCITLDSAEGFNWTHYRYILRLIKGSRVPIIVVSSSLSAIPASIKKVCMIVKVEPLSLKDIKLLVSVKFPEFTGDIAKIWRLSGKNMNIFINNIIYNHISDTIITETYSLKTITEHILTNPDRDLVFKMLHNTEKRWDFIISWLRENILIHCNKQDTAYYLGKLAWIDANKYRTSNEYIMSIIAYGINPLLKQGSIWARFPDLFYRKKKKVEVGAVKEKITYSKKVEKVKEKSKQKTFDEIFDVFNL